MEHVLPAFHDLPPAIRDYEDILGAGASSDVTNDYLQVQGRHNQERLSFNKPQENAFVLGC